MVRGPKTTPASATSASSPERRTVERRQGGWSTGRAPTEGNRRRHEVMWRRATSGIERGWSTFCSTRRPCRRPFGDRSIGPAKRADGTGVPRTYLPHWPMLCRKRRRRRRVQGAAAGPGRVQMSPALSRVESQSRRAFRCRVGRPQGDLGPGA